MPTSIRGLVAARLDALPPRDRALLLDAAVVGKVFWHDALLALSPEPDIDHVLEELERRDLIRREASSIIENQQQLTFTHVLIRDVAYELLPRADRARRHEAVAQFFERSTGSSNEAIGALAHHWRDAGDFERAIAQLTRAAEQAERGWAKDHAVMLYREALELVPEDDDGAAQRASPPARDREHGVVPPRRRQTAGKSAGVTSPTISSIESMRCWPRRLEWSRTIASLGASYTQNVRTLPSSSTTTWLCSQVISGSSSSTISRERRPTAGIWDSPTSKLRTIM